jgi:hypothetical protein
LANGNRTLTGNGHEVLFFDQRDRLVTQSRDFRFTAVGQVRSRRVSDVGDDDAQGARPSGPQRLSPISASSN